MILWSPDKARTGPNNSSTEVFLRDSGQGKLVAFLGHGSAKWATFSPDSRRLLFLSIRGMELWDTATGRSLAVLGGCGPPIGFSPDSSRIICHSRNGLRLWDSANGAPADNLKKSSANASIASESQPTYKFRDNWIVGSFEGQWKWICWLPLAVRGEKPVVSSGGECFVLGNETGDWTLFDLSHVQWAQS
jgi:hypothetical protein